jgi:hypothetical protein
MHNAFCEGDSILTPGISISKDALSLHLTRTGPSPPCQSPSAHSPERASSTFSSLDFKPTFTFITPSLILRVHRRHPIFSCFERLKGLLRCHPSPPLQRRQTQHGMWESWCVDRSANQQRESGSTLVWNIHRFCECTAMAFFHRSIRVKAERELLAETVPGPFRLCPRRAGCL